jgi:diguanylate cyclase (GGDEF)-like protein
MRKKSMLKIPSPKVSEKPENEEKAAHPVPTTVAEKSTPSLARLIEPRSMGILAGAAVFLCVVMSLAPRLADERLPWWISFTVGLVGAGIVAALMAFASKRLLEHDRTTHAERSSERATFQQREQYLAALAEAESHLLADVDGEGYRAALGALGRAAGASRVSLYSIKTDPRDQSLLSILQETWQHTGVAANMPLGELTLTREFSRWLEVLVDGGLIEGLVSALPVQEKPLLEAHGIRTLLVLAVGEPGKTPRGVLLLENPRTPSQDHLRAAAAAFFHAEARREIERATRRQALHDPLTDLPNRRHLKEELERRVAEATRLGAGLAVVFLDLDRFKQINDTLGHDFGDRFLQYVVRHRLHPCLGNTDFLARVGGDEFVLILSGSREGIHADALQRAAAILRSLMLPITLEGQELYISTSIGISLYPDNGDDVETLMKQADVAMYAVKENGKNNFRYFEPAMLEGATDKLKLEADLRHALDPRFINNDVFILHFQPQVDVTTGRMVGMEGLARWNHPERGLLMPSEFVGLAEEAVLMLPLGEHLLRTACRQGVIWLQRGIPLRISVNLSASQIHERELVNQVERVLSETRLPPENLELEFTETAMMKDIGGAQAVMKALKNIGVRLSIDDFGAGASSVAQLKDFPFDCVKIERLFIQSLLESERDHKLAQALIALAQAMNAQVVAEGVETRKQCEVLASMGCTVMQGHLFSPALSVSEIETRFFAKKAA